MIWLLLVLQWLGEIIEVFGRLQLMGGLDEVDVSEVVVGYNICGVMDVRSVGKRKFFSMKVVVVMEMVQI